MCPARLVQEGDDAMFRSANASLDGGCATPSRGCGCQALHYPHQSRYAKDPVCEQEGMTEPRHQYVGMELKNVLRHDLAENEQDRRQQ